MSGLYYVFFFFKQKTAYEMRISDWSSDVCSSDLDDAHQFAVAASAKGSGGSLAARSRAISEAFQHAERPPAVVQLGLDIVQDGVVDVAQDDGAIVIEIGRASCRERVCQYV